MATPYLRAGHPARLSRHAAGDWDYRQLTAVRISPHAPIEDLFNSPLPCREKVKTVQIGVAGLRNWAKRIIEPMLDTPTDAPHRTGEFDLIARLQKLLSDEGRNAPGQGPLIGIGDDCAVVLRDGKVGLLTSDAMVDGVHFRSGQIDWYNLGWKAVVSNQSDIAAMGGTPEHALVTLGVTADVSTSQIEAVYRGMAAATNEFGGEIVGGDTVRSAVFFISVALVGSAGVRATGEPALLRRDAAKVGDLVAVTGTVGGSAGGLRALAEGRNSRDAEYLKNVHFRPRPRVELGRALVDGGFECGIDVSDGLMADLAHICESSGVGAAVDTHKVPVPDELRREYPDDWLDLALCGGEDYELIVVGPGQFFQQLDESLARELHVVGRITERPPETQRPVIALAADGTVVSVAKYGWDHFGG